MSRKKISMLAVGAVIVVGVAMAGEPAPSAAVVDPSSSTPTTSQASAPTSISPTARAASPSPSLDPTRVPLDGTVAEVVDGETIRVDLPGGLETVRIIGIDTPEVVHPTQPEACFGAEATAFAKQTLDGKAVRLELDPSQDERDRYDRLLAHVYVGDELYTATAIAGGFGIHYVYEVPSLHAAELDAAQSAAETGKLGIWASCQGRVDLPLSAVAPATPKAIAPKPAATAKPKPTKDTACHPSYDPCVPDAGYDLDCKDIGFNVDVIGPDEYRLDGSDNDGRRLRELLISHPS